METQQVRPSLDTFLKNKQKEILDVAHRNTEEIVKTEIALMDFEILLAVNMSKKDQKELTKEARELRKERWGELSKRFNGDVTKIQDFLLQSKS